MKRKIILPVLILVAPAGLFGVKEYFRTHDNLAGEKPVAALTAAQLIAAFETDTAQTQQYIDQVIRVTGFVTGMAAEDNPVVISLGENGKMSSVQCSMDSTHPLPAAIIVGKQVIVKGICTGDITEELFGTDVKLARCLVETNKP